MRTAKLTVKNNTDLQRIEIQITYNIDEYSDPLFIIVNNIDYSMNPNLLYENDDILDMDIVQDKDKFIERTFENKELNNTVQAFKSFTQNK